jgi:hypothetical protein
MKSNHLIPGRLASLMCGLGITFVVGAATLTA